jgi:hypothetical protein
MKTGNGWLAGRQLLRDDDQSIAGRELIHRQEAKIAKELHTDDGLFRSRLAIR